MQNMEVNVVLEYSLNIFLHVSSLGVLRWCRYTREVFCHWAEPLRKTTKKYSQVPIYGVRYSKKYSKLN